MTQFPLKYVLTGAPCTGKTSLINYFNKLGYQTVEEAASILIEEDFRTNTIPFWQKDLIGFQRKLIQKQLELESKTDVNKICIIDRGIIDTIAYCKIFEHNIPDDFLVLAKKNKYSKIFILDFLNNYSTSFIRTESFEKAKKIQGILKSTYIDFGYQPIHVPDINIENRIKFILNSINYNTQKNVFMEIRL